jgi:serine/threonine protein phosphatase PrpC
VKLFGRRKDSRVVSLAGQGEKDATLVGVKAVTIPVQKTSQPSPRQFHAVCGQSVGKQRDHNEDSLFMLTATTGGVGNPTPLGLFVIADGMGGHQHGEVASSVAARTAAHHLLGRLLPVFAPTTEGTEEPLQEMMRSAIAQAQEAVTRKAPGGGTTLSMALALGDQLTIGHVGDSRIYSLHPDGKTEVLTRDHSMVKRLEEMGEITSEEAVNHPQKNVLYRAIGQGELLEGDIFTIPFPPGGYLLLCSDGLWGQVPDKDISRKVLSSTSLENACQELVDAANNAGGPDNISVILVQMRG